MSTYVPNILNRRYFWESFLDVFRIFFLGLLNSTYLLLINAHLCIYWHFVCPLITFCYPTCCIEVIILTAIKNKNTNQSNTINKFNGHG